MATASRKPRPGLTLIIFLLAIGAMFGIMSVSGTWSPKLGLDLQGGTTVTLTATNSTVEKKSLELAKSIIQKRVDGLGIGEAWVAASGDRNIVVSAPNVQRDDLVRLIGSTADSLLLAPQEFGMRDECRGCHSFTITRVGITGEEMGTMPGIAQLRPAGWVERFKDPAAAAEIINRGGDPKEIGFALRKLPRELVDVDSGTVIDPGDLSPSEIPTPTGPAILLEKPSKDEEGHDISPVVSWLNVAAGEKTLRTDDLTYLTDKNNFNGVAAERIRMGEETNTW